MIGYDLTIHSPYLSIRETVVRGCKELTEEEILALAAVRPAANILTLNPDAINRRIRTNPWIQEVFIGREFPDRLVIMVRERKAVALLQGKKSLSPRQRGVAFQKAGTRDEFSLPILTGCVREGKTDEALVKKSLALLNYLADAKVSPPSAVCRRSMETKPSVFSLFTDVGLCLKLGFDGYEQA